MFTFLAGASLAWIIASIRHYHRGYDRGFTDGKRLGERMYDKPVPKPPDLTVNRWQPMRGHRQNWRDQ